MPKLLDATELNLIKETAFENGGIEQDILSIIGILLRDYILLKKGIPISDIDEHEKLKSDTDGN